jgi:hypothetical protein
MFPALGGDSAQYDVAQLFWCLFSERFQNAIMFYAGTAGSAMARPVGEHAAFYLEV